MICGLVLKCCFTIVVVVVYRVESRSFTGLLSVSFQLLCLPDLKERLTMTESDVCNHHKMRNSVDERIVFSWVDMDATVLRDRMHV